MHVHKLIRGANAQDYVSLSFSADGKTIVAQAGAPEWYLLVWSWEKAKVVATTKTSNQQSAPIYQVSAAPSPHMPCMQRPSLGLAKVPQTAKQL